MDFSPMPTTKESPSQDAFEQALEDRLRSTEGTDSALTSQQIRQGIPFDRLQRLAERLTLTQQTLTRVLGISERTLQRRKEAGRLSPEESDRVERLLRIWRLALRAFDDEEDDARAWLTTPKRALDDETPVEHLDTEPGARAVSEMLIVIDQTIPA
jgi:putative toxin-antitoxin system antitoxin component, TIGR02293 family